MSCLSRGMMSFWGLSLVIATLAAPTLAGPAAKPARPKLRDLLKPAVYERMVKEREVMTSADLEDGRKYSVYAAMLVRENLSRTREILTDYRLYPKMIPYVDRADFDDKKRTLEVAGGIWKYRLVSLLKFQEESPEWVSFEIIGGHFKGLKGEFLFESLGEKGTAVMIRGELTGKNWPPAFVIEQGAEIVFGFTGARMRSFIESSDEPKSNHDTSRFPQPRGRL